MFGVVLFGGVQALAGKKENEKKSGGLSGGIKSAANLPQSSLFPTHVPYTEIKRTNTPLFLMTALPSIIN